MREQEHPTSFGAAWHVDHMDSSVRNEDAGERAEV